MMRDTFHTITEGAYSNLLFKLFGKDRVEAELEEFLKFNFFPRVGGGIGMTRMISALETRVQKDKSTVVDTAFALGGMMPADDPKQGMDLHGWE
jgi:hypothetical protein